MNKIVAINIIMNCVIINAMQQRAIIYPFFSKEASIVAIKKTMDKKACHINKSMK